MSFRWLAAQSIVICQYLGTGDIVGTLRYMAPERLSGRGDARSDVYGLGVTLYEMITLRSAFDETDRCAWFVKSRMMSRPVRAYWIPVCRAISRRLY